MKRSRVRVRAPKIVQPGRRRWLWPGVPLLLAGLAIAWAAHQQGQRGAGYHADVSRSEIASLREEVARLRAALEAERVRAARFERAAQIDRAAAESVRRTLREAEHERAELRQQVAMLNSLLSGKVAVLEVSEVRLRRGEDEGVYRFSFIVSKRDKSAERVGGRVRVSVAGQLDGKPVTLDEERLEIGGPLKMGFKHFQRFEGRLKLPVGFIPRELVIRGKPSGKRFGAFEKRVEWQV